MKTLYLMRHAKSSWDDASLDDHDRPLNARGRVAAVEMANRLASGGEIPELLLVSTACRTLQTVGVMVRAWGREIPATLNPHLYHAGPNTILEAVRAVSERTQSVLLLAHNPGLEELVSALAGRLEPFPTAAVAYCEIEEAWADCTPEALRLCAIWRPGDIASQPQ